MGAFNVFDFAVVEEADAGAAPDDPVAVMLDESIFSLWAFFAYLVFENPHPRECNGKGTKKEKVENRTSRLVTGFSSNDRCVSRGRFLSASRSASSARLLAVRIRVVKWGTEAASVDWMLLIRLRASRRVCRRGDKGKLARAVMSLSVKSMASWSCIYMINLFLFFLLFFVRYCARLS